MNKKIRNHSVLLLPLFFLVTLSKGYTADDQEILEHLENSQQKSTIIIIQDSSQPPVRKRDKFKKLIGLQTAVENNENTLPRERKRDKIKKWAGLSSEQSNNNNNNIELRDRKRDKLARFFGFLSENDRIEYPERLKTSSSILLLIDEDYSQNSDLESHFFTGIPLEILSMICDYLDKRSFIALKSIDNATRMRIENTFEHICKMRLRNLCDPERYDDYKADYPDFDTLHGSHYLFYRTLIDQRLSHHFSANLDGCNLNTRQFLIGSERVGIYERHASVDNQQHLVVLPQNFLEQSLNVRHQIDKLILNSSVMLHLPKNILTQFPYLRELYITSTRLEEFPDDILNLQTLEHLSLTNNHIQYFPDISCLKNLKSINIYGNRIKHFPETLDISYFKSFQFVNFDNNPWNPDALIKVNAINQIFEKRRNWEERKKRIKELPADAIGFAFWGTLCLVGIKPFYPS